MENIATSPINLAQFWAEMEHNLADAAKKIDFLKNFKTSSGLSVVKYPSGFPFQTLRKVCTALKQAEVTAFADFDYLLVEAGHQTVFHLVRNTSVKHGKFEEFSKNNGGILSEKITDCGELRIVHSDDSGKITVGADFSLYKTKDDTFVI